VFLLVFWETGPPEADWLSKSSLVTEKEERSRGNGAGSDTVASINERAIFAISSSSSGTLEEAECFWRTTINWS